MPGEYRSGHLAALERRQGAQDDWSPSERLYLTQAAQYLSMSSKHLPPYPLVDHAGLDPVEARVPAYQLQDRFEGLAALCGAYCALLYQPITDGRLPREALPIIAERKEKLARDFAKTPHARELRAQILEPCYGAVRSDLPGTVAARRGAYPWHAVPRLVLESNTGMARRWAAVELLRWCYSPWRTAPQTLPDPQPLLDPWRALADVDL